MIALVSAVAAPVAAAVIWAALRTPLARRLAAKPSAHRWHTRATPAVGGTGVFAGILSILVIGIAVELCLFAPLERHVLRSRGLLGRV